MRYQNCSRCYSSPSYPEYIHDAFTKLRGRCPDAPDAPDITDEELDATVAILEALQANNDITNDITLRGPSKGNSPSTSDCNIQRARNTELSQTANILPGFVCQGSLGQIIELYLQAELIARKILTYHAIDNKLPFPDGIDIKLLKQALKIYKFVPTIMSIGDFEWIFKGGQGIRGEKSIRQLRNGYFHELNKDDRNEIEQYYGNFLSLLQRFNNIQIRKFKC